jgi:hypothetical protein
MPGVFCQYVNFCKGVRLLANGTSTQNMKYRADKNNITHRNFLIGLITDSTLPSLNCDFQWDNCQELYHSPIPNKKTEIIEAKQVVIHLK